MIKIPDIIQLNDWEPKKFLRTMCAIHLAMLGAVALDLIGLEIPILRQVVGFVYLTFVPGIVIIRLLKIHRLGIVETILLSTGLSVSFLMFSGFFLNTVLSFLNINSPLSFRNVVLFTTAIVAILCIISYRTNRFYQYELPPLNISSTALCLMLLPVLGIIGTYFVNFHSNNILLLILIALIAFIPVLVAAKKIPSVLYPLTLVVIAISLLFHNSLISMYISGYDIHLEYYTYKIVANNAYWRPNIYSNLNAMLSIVILPATYSNFLKMDGTWIFKIVYPIILSLTPLGLYRIYQRQMKNNEIAFYSVFFFMSFYTFYTEMLSLARQEIAELFFVLLIFLTVQDTLNKNIRNTLILIFSASLVTSHYGLSYIYMFLIILIFLFSKDWIRNSKIKSYLPEFNLKNLTLNYFLAFYIVFLLLWYMNVSRSSAFNTIVGIGDHIYGSIFNEFLSPSPETMDRNVLMAIGATDPIVSSIGRNIHRNLQLITQFLIVLGFLKIIVYREYAKFKAEYFYLIVASLVILLLSILPNFAISLNMTRIYHIALFALSPLFIIGGMYVGEVLIKIMMLKNKLIKDHAGFILILFVLIPYFLFNVGLVYEITKDSPTSMSLGMERMKNDKNTRDLFYTYYVQEQDVYGARWYYKNANAKVYADSASRSVLRSYGIVSDYIENPLIRFKPKKYFIFLSKKNVCEDSVFYRKTNLNVSEIPTFFNESNRVYSNGCGEIYTK